MGNEEVVVNELRAYIDNDYDLYRQQTLPIYKNLNRKVEKEIYEFDKAVKLFTCLVDNGARKYVRAYGGTVKNLFPKQIRLEVARQLAECHIEEVHDNWERGFESEPPFNGKLSAFNATQRGEGHFGADKCPVCIWQDEQVTKLKQTRESLTNLGQALADKQS